MKLICDGCGFVFLKRDNDSRDDWIKEGAEDIGCRSKKPGTLVPVTPIIQLLLDNAREWHEVAKARADVIKEERRKVAEYHKMAQEAVARAAGLDRKVLEELLWAGDRMRERLPDESFHGQKWDESLEQVEDVYPRTA